MVLALTWKSKQLKRQIFGSSVPLVALVNIHVLVDLSIKI